MRVLWFSNTPGLGAELLGVPPAIGIGWQAALEGAVAARGDVELCLAFPWEVDEIREVGGPRRYLPYPRYPRGGRLQRALFEVSGRLEPPGELAHLDRAIELSRPDLIHVWGTEEAFGLVAQRCDLPVLIEIQGIRTPYTAAYFNGLSRTDLLRHGSPARLLTGRSLLHRYTRYRRSAAREREILKAARFVSGRTEWDRLSMRALAPKARYFHCDRVLRPEFYHRSRSPRTDRGELRIVTTIRGNAYKGLETVWQCARLLCDLLPKAPSWDVLGVREGEEIARIVESKFGAGPRARGVVRLRGRKSAAEVAEQLLDSDLYVHPSHIDNSPNGLCEAILIGLPVVSTHVGGVPSLVSDGDDGLLIPAGDPWAMAGAIVELAGDPDKAERLARAGRRRALARHDPTSVAETLAGIYREILASSRASAGPPTAE